LIFHNKTGLMNDLVILHKSCAGKVFAFQPNVGALPRRLM